MKHVETDCVTCQGETRIQYETYLPDRKEPLQVRAFAWLQGFSTDSSRFSVTAETIRLDLGIVLEGDVVVACPLGPAFAFEVGFLSELVEVLQEYAAFDGGLLLIVGLAGGQGLGAYIDGTNQTLAGGDVVEAGNIIVLVDVGHDHECSGTAFTCVAMHVQPFVFGQVLHEGDELIDGAIIGTEVIGGCETNVVAALFLDFNFSYGFEFLTAVKSTISTLTVIIQRYVVPKER